jgi:hypothetical protein
MYPGMQGKQNALPTTRFIVLGGHGSHERAPCVENRPMAHAWHVDEPRAAAKNPAGHALQFAAAGLLLKRPCWHAAHALAPAGE